MIGAAIASCAVSFADTHKWIGPEGGSWKEPSFFEPAEVPDKDDEVEIPNNVTVKINPSTDPDSWSVITSLKRLRPLGAATRMEITVPGGSSSVLGCAINYAGAEESNWKYGTLVKLGEGELEITSTNRYTKAGNTYNYDYFTCFDVCEGALRMPRISAKPSYLEYGRIAVSNGATLFASATLDSKVSVYMRVRQLFGDGLVTNDCYTAGASALRPFGDNYSVFSGVIAGNMSISTQGRIDLTGENTLIEGTFSAGFNKVQGARGVGVAKIGKIGEASSIGGGMAVSLGPDYGGYLLYLGANETSDKNFTMAAGTSGGKYYNTIDAGAYGGLVLTGNLNYRSNKENSYMVNAMFTGSNAAPCEYKGNISEYFAITVDDDGVKVKYTNTYFVTKSGSGTWRFSGTRDMGGGFAVENGVLEFDSLAETNKICALGKATMLTPAGQFGRYVNLPKVPYAYTLGSGKAGEEGIMRYIGDASVYVKTRPSVLKGRGGFENNGTAPFQYYGVSALDAGEKCLVLGGSNTDENILGDVISGVEGAVVSLEKRGSGTWTLAGEQSFNGDLHVKEGKLIVRRPEHYTWYKWLVKELYKTGERWTEATEFGLFDIGGNRQNLGLSFAEDKNKILPGTTRIVPTRDDLLMTTADNVVEPEVVLNLMEDASSHLKVGLTKTPDAPSKDYYKPRLDNSAGWVPVVMRLPDGASPVASFDWVPRHNYSTDPNDRCSSTPWIYSVLGSMDGRNWDELFATNSVTYDMRSSYWKYAGAKYTSGMTASTKHVGGQEIASAPIGYEPPQVLSDVRSVRVDAGAVLELAEGNVELSSLAVDCAAGAGTIKGFTFAAEGTLDLVNASSIEGVADVMIDISATDGWENIAGWTLTVNGSSDQASRYCFSVSEDRIRVAKRGLRFIVR